MQILGFHKPSFVLSFSLYLFSGVFSSVPMAPKVAPAQVQQLSLVPMTYTTQHVYAAATGGTATMTVPPNRLWWHTLQYEEQEGEQIPVCVSPTGEFVPVPPVSRPLYISSKNMLFYMHDGKAVFIEDDYKFSTRFANIPLQGCEWKIVVHKFNTPRQGAGCLFFEINTFRQPLQLDVSKDTDKRWVNSKWETWKADVARISCGGSGGIEKSMLPSEKSWLSHYTSKKVEPPEHVMGRDCFLEFSACVVPTLIMLCRWARTLGDIQKKNARDMLSAFVRAGSC